MARASRKKRESKTDDHWVVVHEDALTPLANRGHEIFCQMIAKGATQTEAYLAGVAKPGTKKENAASNASQLMKEERIRSRVQWLKHRERMAFDINQHTLTEHLLEVVDGAKKVGDWAAARAALADVAKLHGLMIERSEVNGTVRHIGELHLDALKKLMNATNDSNNQPMKVIEGDAMRVNGDRPAKSL